LPVQDRTLKGEIELQDVSVYSGDGGGGGLSEAECRLVFRVYTTEGGQSAQRVILSARTEADVEKWKGAPCAVSYK